MILRISSVKQGWRQRNGRPLSNTQCFVGWLLMVILGIASPANASSIIDFNIDATHTGTPSISFAGGASALIGVDIDVDTVLGIGTPLNSGLSHELYGPPGGPSFSGVEQAKLSFTTGPFIGTNGGSEWVFGPGGTITIVGGADLTPGFVNAGHDFGNGTTSDAEDIATGTVLLSGIFANNTRVIQTATGLEIVSSGLVDTKTSALLAFYGLPVGSIGSGMLNLQFTTSFATPGDPFNATGDMVFSGDVANNLPEPASLTLALAGVAGLAWACRASRRRRNPGG